MQYVVIPARHGSTRLLGKPLLNIGDRYVLFHVLDQVSKVFNIEQIRVATDHDLIIKACEMYGVKGVMTSPEHESGTDRIAEVCEKEGWNDNDVVINVQGDEPFIPTSLLKTLREVGNSASVNAQSPSMATAYHRVDNYKDIFDPNVVKLVLGKDDKALYFSRAPIPWHRDTFHYDNEGVNQPYNGHVHRHIGVYVYSVASLKNFGSLTSTLEGIEKLEQLKLLENNIPIYCFKAEEAPILGIDTRADLVNANRHWDDLQKEHQ